MAALACLFDCGQKVVEVLVVGGCFHNLQEVDVGQSELLIVNIAYLPTCCAVKSNSLRESFTDGIVEISGNETPAYFQAPNGTSM